MMNPEKFFKILMYEKRAFLVIIELNFLILECGKEAPNVRDSSSLTARAKAQAARFPRPALSPCTTRLCRALLEGAPATQVTQRPALFFLQRWLVTQEFEKQEVHQRWPPL